MVLGRPLVVFTTGGTSKNKTPSRWRCRGLERLWERRAQGRTVVGAETGLGSMSDPSQSGSHTIRPGSLAVAWAESSRGLGRRSSRTAWRLPSRLRVLGRVGQCGS